jgi:hypothetical protein
MAKNPGPSKNEEELLVAIQEFKYDPLEFSRYIWPWGERKTPLAEVPGPRTWQADEFKRITDHLLLDLEKQRIGLPPTPYYLSISSGRGPGKSAFLAMLNYWAASCWIGGTAIMTANTETQLRSRTMAELGKWHTMALNRHWFDKSTMSLRPAKWFADLIERQLQMDTQYYYVEGQSWSAENPDAFAGAHSTVSMMLSMDEASGIDDTIWSVSEGFFTDLSGMRLWVAISNPRRNTGKFFDCFHTDRDFWQTRTIDSRTVEGIDAAVYQRIADKYGEESDVTRVEVKGEFPRTGNRQFISRETTEDAAVRELVEDPYEPLIMGIDVARFGDDRSVFRWRRGRDARSIPKQVYKRLNTMELAQEAANWITKTQPDAIMVDGGGVGGGVVDRLKMMGYRVIEVQSAARPFQPDRYLNKRVEIWDEMREWLEIGCIDDDFELQQDLTGPEYDKHPQTGKLILESKDSMKKRGLESTDDGDALALTFAQKVARLDKSYSRSGRGERIARDVDYSIFG